MKKSCLLLLLLVTTTLLAHEFWLQPDKFIYKRGERVNIKFLVGENFTGENWSGNRSRVKNLQLYFRTVTDNLANLLEEVKGDSLQLTIMDEGSGMITFNSTNSFIELEAQKFTDYLKEDGLKEAFEYRQQNGQRDSAGREYYQRSVKTIFQVGTKRDTVFKRRTTLPLDIIPQTNPYRVTGKQQIKLMVLFQQQPLQNTIMKVWHRYKNKTAMQEVATNNKGELIITVAPTGRWMVSTIKMIHLDNDPKAQWQSYWGSVTWGYY